MAFQKTLNSRNCVSSYVLLDQFMCSSKEPFQRPPLVVVIPFHSIALDVAVFWKDKTDIQCICVVVRHAVSRKYQQFHITYKYLSFHFFKTLFFLLHVRSCCCLSLKWGWKVTKKLIEYFCVDSQAS